MHWIGCLIVHLLFQELFAYLHLLLHARSLRIWEKVSFRKYPWHLNSCILIVALIHSMLLELPGFVTVEIRGSFPWWLYRCLLDFELDWARHCILLVNSFATRNLLQLPITAICRFGSCCIDWNKLAWPWGRIVDGLNESLVMCLLQSLRLRKILWDRIFTKDSSSIRSVSVGSIQIRGFLRHLIN